MIYYMNLMLEFHLIEFRNQKYIDEVDFFLLMSGHPLSKSFEISRKSTL